MRYSRGTVTSEALACAPCTKMCCNCSLSWNCTHHLELQPKFDLDPQVLACGVAGVYQYALWSNQRTPAHIAVSYENLMVARLVWYSTVARHADTSLNFGGVLRDLSGATSLTHLGSNAFRALSRLQRLYGRIFTQHRSTLTIEHRDLRNSPIATLPTNAFVGLSALTEMYARAPFVRCRSLIQ